MSPQIGVPREVTNPFRPIPLEIPEGVTPTEFFNSPGNLRHLARENGLLRTEENFLLYRKAIGHSNLFDTSIILDTSQIILDPLGRPVRRDQLIKREKFVFSRMTQVVFQYMMEKFPEPDRLLLDKPEVAKVYVEMLSTIQGRVAKLLKEGKTLEEIQAARPTEEFDADWGKVWLDGDEFTRLVVMSLSGS